MGYHVAVAVGQIWESRQVFRGRRERIEIIRLTGLEARVRSLNPLPGKPIERTLGVGLGVGRVQLAGMRLVTLADGTPFVP